MTGGASADPSPGKSPNQIVVPAKVGTRGGNGSRFRRDDTVLPVAGFISSCRFRLRLGERGLCRLDNRGEGFRLADCQVGQDLPVELEPGELCPVHELRVGQSVFADAGVDALDPQSAEVALLVAAVAIGVAQRLLDLLNRDAVGGAAAAAITLGEAEHLFVAGMRCDAAFDPGHAFNSADTAYRSRRAWHRPFRGSSCRDAAASAASTC